MLAISLLILLSAEPTAATDREFGAVMAPAVLPKGSNALYGFIGAPNVGIGYRQGFLQNFEFETIGSINFLQLSGLAEFGFRAPLIKSSTDPTFVLSMATYLGATYNSGNTYFDTSNFKYFGFTGRMNLMGSYRIHSIVYLLGRIEAPVILPITARGISFAPTGGAGAEIRLGDGLSLLVFGTLGAEVKKEPLGVLFVRPAWSIQLGVGTRFF